jgi:acyl-coenzyme A synthetase/AMP-(fatty) acid ligase
MLPLIGHCRTDAVVAYRGGVAVSAGQFLADVTQLEAILGGTRHVLNACADRYRFSVGLAACIVSGRANLLPPTSVREVISQLRGFAPDAVCLTDEEDCTIDLPLIRYPARALPPASSFHVPLIDEAQVVAYVFTSGSTGAPVPWRKTFGRVAACVREESRRLGLDGSGAAIVATVPPQHMYGLESSVLMPLTTGHALCAERPFFPADVVAVLARTPRPRVLVSTPVHLRALLSLGTGLPAVDLVVSATAPLAQQLALEVENAFETRLLEIYGSTETGKIATRRPSEETEWHLWPGVRFSARDDETWADGGHVEQPTRMCDVLEVTGRDTFLLHGRQADLVNIAGKRSSLSYLNHQLNSIPGVLDGAFFHVEEARGSNTGVARVAACVVAPQLDVASLTASLRERIDPVFLPRPLVFVSRLPRNSTGKLPQEALMTLAAAHLKSSVA